MYTFDEKWDLSLSEDYQGRKDYIHNILEQNSDATVRLQYDELFKVNKQSSDEQTFIQN